MSGCCYLADYSEDRFRAYANLVLRPTKGLKFADVPNGLAALSKAQLGHTQVVISGGFGIQRAWVRVALSSSA